MYEHFYGLSGRPFQLTPDPDFYFESASHKKAMSYLGYGLAQGEGFIVITGEIGAGKSTLVAHLMQCIDPAQLTIGKIVTSALDGDELIHVVAQSFGLAVEGHDKAGALGAIEHFLGEEARAGRRCLLIVDEGQNLDIEALEELRMLSNFQLGSHPLLQTLLLGQPEFRALVANHPELEQLRQRIIASHHLSALKPDELQDYVEHRMQQVGWDGNPALGAELFAALYRATDGIPRRVNQVMNRMLLLGAIEERAEFSPEMIEAVVAEMAGDTQGGAERAPVRVEPTQTAAVAPQAELSAADDTAIAEMLAERDARIAELEQAVTKLHHAAERPGRETPGADMDLSEIEQRLEEQEHTLRHVLTMLIEFFEDAKSREAA
ncbi:XrtA-associated ATPase [Altererythrobacter arenosus]|uniref:XrtA-associated ATPase n=1 Tax=Altererythrobacter arenosus TaxID=3032592 RepID=A0ABY8FQA0_9SPHN|nr:XrtA/PEP-CTERM system-associated ATPase [Altererythrobacter sp. CAU 1644]WFL77187.1 XrtA-associated ATPase [Altererythrobacter sp. CAU 1644]